MTRGTISLSHSTGAGDFAALARGVMLARGRSSEIVRFAEAPFMPERCRRIFAKSAQNAFLLSDSASAMGDVDLALIQTAFLDTLKTAGAFDALLAANAFMAAPLQTRLLGASASVAGATLEEGRAMPVSGIVLSGAILAPMKAGALLALTMEMLAAGGSKIEGFISRELRIALAKATDEKFLDVIEDGVTTAASLDSNGGTDFDAIASDVGAILGALTLGDDSRPTLLISRQLAKRLMTMTTTLGQLAFPGFSLAGGSIANVDALATSAVSDGSVYGIDAAGIAAASEGVTLDSSQEAALEMETAPQANVSSPTEPSNNMISLWQTDSIALKADRIFGLAIARSGAVSQMANVAWGEGSGS